MNLNSYIIKDYLEIPAHHASLQSSVLERPLESIAFYRPDLSPEKNLVIIISLDDLNREQNHLKNGCFICPCQPNTNITSCSADILLLDENIPVTPRSFRVS